MAYRNPRTSFANPWYSWTLRDCRASRHNRVKWVLFSPKRRVGRSNRLAGASSGGKPSEIPKVFRFFHNLLEFEGGRFILHFKGGRFILSDLLIVIAVPLKSNCILSAPKILLIDQQDLLIFSQKSGPFANWAKQRLRILLMKNSDGPEFECFGVCTKPT